MSRSRYPESSCRWQPLFRSLWPKYRNPERVFGKPNGAIGAVELEANLFIELADVLDEHQGSPVQGLCNGLRVRVSLPDSVGAIPSGGRLRASCADGMGQMETRQW